MTRSDELAEATAEPNLDRRSTLRTHLSAANGRLVAALGYPVAWLAALVVLPLLPDIVATTVAFSLVFVAPGLAILLLASGRWSLAEAIILGALLGVGQVAVLSLPALLLHMPLVWVAVPHVVVTVATIFLAGGSGRATIDLTPLGGTTAVLLLALMFLVSGLTGDGRWYSVDDWHDLPYTVSYFEGDDINAEDPVIDDGVDITSRRLFNVISVDQALVAEVGGVDVINLGLNHFHLLAALLAGLGVFALGTRLAGGEERAGVVAVALLAAAALIDLQTVESFGRGLLLRPGDDKFLAALVLTPAFTVLALDYDGRTDRTALLAIGALALALMHPFGVAFAAIVLAPDALAALWRSWSGDPDGRRGLFSSLAAGERRVLLGSSLVIALAALPALYQRFLFDDSFGDRFGGENQVNLDVRRFDLPAGFVALDWSMLTNPLLWLAVVATPLLIWRLREVRLRLFVATTMLLLPAALVFPPTATLLGKLGSPGLLWRFLFVMPFAGVLGALLVSQSRNGLVLASSVALLAATAVGLKEGLAAVNEGYYGEAYGDSAVQSGLESTLDTNFLTGRLQGEEVEAFFAELDGIVEDDALVLMPFDVQGIGGPQDDLALPAYVPEAKSYTNGVLGQVTEVDWDEEGAAGALLDPGHVGFRERAIFSALFYADRLPPMIRVEGLFAAKRITHVLVPAGSAAETLIASSPSFDLVGRLLGEYLLYARQR